MVSNSICLSTIPTGEFLRISTWRGSLQRNTGNHTDHWYCSPATLPFFFSLITGPTLCQTHGLPFYSSKIKHRPPQNLCIIYPDQTKGRLYGPSILLFLLWVTLFAIVLQLFSRATYIVMSSKARDMWWKRHSLALTQQLPYVKSVCLQCKMLSADSASPHLAFDAERDWRSSIWDLTKVGKKFCFQNILTPV